MTPDEMYALVLRIERDKVFRERLERDPKSTLVYNCIPFSTSDLDVLQSIKWSQGLNNIEIELNLKLQEGTHTAWGYTEQLVAGEWGSIVDIELLEGRDDSDMKKWAAATVDALNAQKAELGFERLYVCQSLALSTLYSLIGAWESQQSALDFPSLLKRQFAIGDIAQIVNVRPAFQVICRVAEPIPGEGMTSSFGVIETWRLLPGADGQKFQKNRFGRFSEEQALKKGFVGSVVGWNLDDPEVFQVVVGYESAEAANACTGNPKVTPFDAIDGARGVGVYAERADYGNYTIAPWASQAPPPLPPVVPAH